MLFSVTTRQICGACFKWHIPKPNVGIRDRLFSFPSTKISLASWNLEFSRDFHGTPAANFRTPYNPALLKAATVVHLKCREYGSKSMNKEPKAKKGGKPKVHLSDEEISEIVNVDGFRTQLTHVVERMRDEYVKQLGLRTSTGTIESLVVEVEGEKYNLNEVGQISRKNPSLIVVNLAATPQAIPSVVAAIQNSGMNLNPQQDGTSVYVPIPQLTREHRENLAKSAKTLFNQTKDELKDMQNRIIKSIKGKKGSFSDDLIFNSQLQITSITETFVSQAETLMQKKQAELLGDKQ